MYEACKSTGHEWTSKDEVDNYKEEIFVEKKNFFRKKDIVNSMKVNYERPLK